MRNKIVAINLSVLLLFIVDRIVKLYFIKNPAVSHGGDFFYGILSFNFVPNTGIAFGIRINQFVVSIIIILILVWLVKLWLDNYRRQQSLNIFSLSLIIVGAISNLIDRFTYGFVVDYIDVKWFSVFNLADAMITIGVLTFGFWVFFFDNKKSPPCQLI